MKATNRGSTRRERRPAWRLSLAFFAALGLVAGCGGAPEEEAATVESDTTAYHAAVAVEDTTAQISALKAFLETYPESTYRPSVYYRVYGLLGRSSPEEAEAFLRGSLESETDPASRGRLYYSLYLWARDHAPDQEMSVMEALENDGTASGAAYNMVAWNLVERDEHLEEAVRLAAIGVERAPDSLSSAMVLDTEGWALYKLGKYEEAVDRLEKAVGYMDDEELRTHLAAAYDKVGKAEEALAIYQKFLYTQENPEYRERAEALTRATGGSVEAMNREIEKRRQENAHPAPDFALKGYDGQEVRLSDLKGKVVLLNFWHPT